MIKSINSYGNVEKLIRVVAEGQKLAKQKDKLTAIVDKCSSYMSEELSEEDLFYVAAAKKPDIPKYKQIKEDM